MPLLEMRQVAAGFRVPFVHFYGKFDDEALK